MADDVYGASLLNRDDLLDKDDEGGSDDDEQEEEGELEIASGEVSNTVGFRAVTFSVSDALEETDEEEEEEEGDDAGDT